jgi:hypothetical protein
MGLILIFVVLDNLSIYVCFGGMTGWYLISLCKFWGLCSGAKKDAVCLGSLVLKSRRWRWHISLKHWGTSRTLYPVTQWNIPEICNPLLVYFQITWLSRVRIFLIVWHVVVVTCDEDENINMIVCFGLVMSNFGTTVFNGIGCCVLRLFHSLSTTYTVFQFALIQFSFVSKALLVFGLHAFEILQLLWIILM